MNTELSKRIKEIALELVAQKSIVETDDEVTMSDKVYEIMSRMDYYKKYPEKLYFVPAKNDKWNRKIVVAVMNGEKKPSDKTVVFIGHTDTVGISDYGNLAEYATKPEELIEKLKEVSLTQEVKDDMASGKYMFGRGIFDMKSGDANVMVSWKWFPRTSRTLKETSSLPQYATKKETHRECLLSYLSSSDSKKNSDTIIRPCWIPIT